MYCVVKINFNVSRKSFNSKLEKKRLLMAILFLQKLSLDKNESEAAQHFLNAINGVIRKSWTVQINWLMHGLVHSAAG